MRFIIPGLLLLFALSAKNACGQQCLSDVLYFLQACPATQKSPPPGECETWTSACGGGWLRSHGTPQFQPYYPFKDPTQVAYYAYMWSAVSGTETLGEGMYTPYSFIASNTYQLKINLITTGGGGIVYIYATNGLTEHSLDACGDDVPTLPSSSKQLIGTYTGVTSSSIGQAIVPITFTPNANYSQIWIYPEASGPTQYNLYVYNIQLCPSCAGDIYYNTGVLPTSATGGNIYAGASVGSGGSGTVTIQTTQVTSLTASSSIYFKPSFQAIPSGAGSLSATIVACNTVNTISPYADSFDSLDLHQYTITNNEAAQLSKTRTVSPDNLNTPGDGTNGPLFSGLTVYPTVSSGTLNIAGPAKDLANTDLTVIDEIGNEVYRAHNDANTSLTLNLGNLPNGLYFIRITQPGHSNFIKKIIIAK